MTWSASGPTLQREADLVSDDGANSGGEHPEGYSERYPKEPWGEFLGLDRTSPWHILMSVSIAGVISFPLTRDEPVLRVIWAVGLAFGVAMFLAVLIYRWRND